MYHRYENGQIPKEKNLAVIASHCNVTIDWLLGRENLAAHSQTVREDAATYGDPDAPHQLIKEKIGDTVRHDFIPFMETELIEGVARAARLAHDVDLVMRCVGELAKRAKSNDTHKETS